MKPAPTVSRRAALTGSLAAASSLALSAPARAQGVHGFRKKMKDYKEHKRDDPSPGWFDSVLPNRGSDGAPDPSSSQTPALLAVSSKAVDAGAEARAYCQKAVLKGDASLQAALTATQDMVPVANALAKLAEVNAVRLGDMAKVATVFLADCEAACRAQAAAHAPCGACADACAAAIRECRAVTG